jgi:hypothetical protein
MKTKETVEHAVVDEDKETNNVFEMRLDDVPEGRRKPVEICKVCDMYEKWRRDSNFRFAPM